MTPLPPTRLPGRGVIRLSGPDTIPLVQSLVTANVARLAEGDAAHAALLTPQGKVQSAFFAWATGEGLLLDVAADDLTPLTQRLGLYKLRAAVQIEDASGELAAFAGDEGPPHARSDPRLAGMGLRWLAGLADQGDPAPYHARRIALGLPEFGADYGPGEAFPMDVNLDALGAVDYKKGCFVGQEVASRMYRRGEVRKRSWRVRGEAPLDVGASVTAGQSTIGTVTSADGTDGIALVRVDRVAAAKDRPQSDGVPVTLSPPGYLP